MSAAMKSSRLHLVQTPSYPLHHLSVFLNSYRSPSTLNRHIPKRHQRIYQCCPPTRCTVPDKELLTAEIDKIARVEFSVAACLDFGLSFKICGNCEELGSWDLESAPAMTWTEGDVWILNVELPVGPTEAKLVAISSDGEFANWEPGENRILQIPNISNEEIVRFNLQYLETEKMEQSITESDDENEPAEKVEVDTEDEENELTESVEIDAEDDENEILEMQAKEEKQEIAGKKNPADVRDVEPSVAAKQRLKTVEVTNHREMTVDEEAKDTESNLLAEISSSEFSKEEESSLEDTSPVGGKDLVEEANLEGAKEAFSEKTKKDIEITVKKQTKQENKIAVKKQTKQENKIAVKKQTEQENEIAVKKEAQDDEQKMVESEVNSKELVWLSVLGLISIPIVGWSEWSLYKTGCGLPPGPVGLLGALEGISYLVIVGIVCYGVIRRLARSGYQPSVLVETGSLLLVVSGLVVLFSQIENYGYIPSALPDKNCPAEPTSVTVPEFFPQ